MRHLALALALVLSAAPTALRADEPLPIFDTHMHYSASAWVELDAPGILDKMERVDVVRALVTSTPDDGTLRLAKAAPKRFVPVLRPYHHDVGSGNGYKDASILDYLSERLDRGGYVGIGEFHLFDRPRRKARWSAPSSRWP